MHETTRKTLTALGAGLGLCLPLVACKQPPPMRSIQSDQASARGRLAIERVGCGACHAIPGIGWPEGAMGPSLADFDAHGPIAGTLPNSAANLAAFVRDAPRAKLGSSMPAMPLSEREARDVAAYLYSLNDG